MSSNQVENIAIAYEMALAEKPFRDSIKIGPKRRGAMLHPIKAIGRAWLVSDAIAASSDVENRIVAAASLRDDPRVSSLWGRLVQNCSSQNILASQEITEMASMDADELYKFQPETTEAEVSLALGRALHHNGSIAVLDADSYETADTTLRFMNALHQICRVSSQQDVIDTQDIDEEYVIIKRTDLGFALSETYTPAYEGSLAAGIALGVPVSMGAQPSTLEVMLIPNNPTNI